MTPLSVVWVTLLDMSTQPGELAMSNSQDLNQALWIHTVSALLNVVDHSTTMGDLPAEFSSSSGPGRD